MKKNPFIFIILLICALTLAGGGLLHPCVHSHSTEYTNTESGEFHSASDISNQQADDSFCPLCSGNLTALSNSTLIQTKFSPETEIQIPDLIRTPLHCGYFTSQSRAPPAPLKQIQSHI